MKTTQDYILALQKKIKSISPANALHSTDALLIDIRNPEELSTGTPKNALHLERSFLEFKIGSD